MQHSLSHHATEIPPATNMKIFRDFLLFRKQGALYHKRKNSKLQSNANSTNEGLLVVNHEHTKARMMHAGVRDEADMNPSQMEVDIMAHGMSVIHIRRIDRQWKYLMDSPYTRRVTPYTPMKFSGPASGHDRLKTLSQPDGTTSLGTYGNCAGGVTPWGTVLSAEENDDNFFAMIFKILQ